MDRRASLAHVARWRDTPCDIAIIGGGATGVGVAVDAASRGYSVCLFEQSDFGKGTSSRSTKLIHGGVRYLQQGNIALVMEALKERGLLRQNAPHLVKDLAFVVPNYAWWETPFYGIGMRVYDMLAGKFGFGKSRILSTEEVLSHIPTLDREGLQGGVLYFDGQFDDARLLIDLAQTAILQGAALLNYAPVVGLLHDSDGFVAGVRFEDAETGERYQVQARAVVNATGPFSDQLRRQDDPAARPMIAASQGVHLVLDRSFLPGDAAIMVPRTSDGRVLFAIPWHEHTLLGTTDTPIGHVSLEPRATAEEISFILETAGEYLAKKPGRGDVRSVFAGIRPLVKSGDAGATAILSREHTLQVARSGLLTIAGGKWTTYRKMAEDCVDHAATLGKLEERGCVTRNLRIHGGEQPGIDTGPLWFYGTAAQGIRQLMADEPELAAPLAEGFPTCGAQVAWAVRREMARTVEDVLARRTRVLFLDARAAVAMAPVVARIMARELHRDSAWQESQVAQFRALAAGYLL
jgi:glycerol-3-phosphate dehydrogenase